MAIAKDYPITTTIAMLVISIVVVLFVTDLVLVTDLPLVIDLIRDFRSFLFGDRLFTWQNMLIIGVISVGLVYLFERSMKK